MTEPHLLKFEPEATYKVIALRNSENHTPLLLIDNGLVVSLLGVVVPPGRSQQAWDYLTGSIEDILSYVHEKGLLWGTIVLAWARWWVRLGSGC